MFMTYTEMIIGAIILCLMVGSARRIGIKEGMKHALETLNLTPQQITMLNEELKKT